MEFSNFSVYGTIVRQLRDVIYIDEGNRVRQYRRVEHQEPVQQNRFRRRSSSLPAPIFPTTPLYVKELAKLPSARVSIENLTKNQVDKILENLERDGLIKKIDLPSRSCKYFRSNCSRMQSLKTVAAVA